MKISMSAFSLWACWHADISIKIKTSRRKRRILKKKFLHCVADWSELLFKHVCLLCSLCLWLCDEWRLLFPWTQAELCPGLCLWLSEEWERKKRYSSKMEMAIRMMMMRKIIRGFLLVLMVCCKWAWETSVHTHLSRHAVLACVEIIV